MKNRFKNLKYVVFIAIISIVLSVIGSIWLSKNIVNNYFSLSDEEFKFINEFCTDVQKVNDFILKYKDEIFDYLSDTTKEKFSDYDDTFILCNAIFDESRKGNNKYYVLKKDTNEIIYNNNSDIIGKKLGTNDKTISKENFEFAKFFGEYGFAKKYDFLDSDLVIFIDLLQIVKKPAIFMAFTLIAFILCTGFLTIYCVVVSEEANLIKEGFSDTVDITRHENDRKKKINIITLTSSVVMICLMMFFNGVYSISIADDAAIYYYDRVKELTDYSKNNINILNEFCNEYYKINNEYVVKMLQNDLNITKENLNVIKNKLDVEEIRVLDINGKTICTSNGIDKFSLSTDEADPSYKCWRLLSEEGFIILPEMQDIYGNAFQNACSTLRDRENNVFGIVMTKYDAKEKYEIEKLFDWYEYIGDILDDDEIIYYVYDKKNEYVAKSSSINLVNSNDVPEEITKGEYQGFYVHNGGEFFGRTIEVDDLIIGIFISLDIISNRLLPNISILILFTIGIYVLYSIFVKNLCKDCTVKREILDDDPSDKFTINKMHINDWSRITGTQKISYLVSYLFSVIMLIFSIILLFGDKIFGETSIINYIINGNWHRSFNVLACSKCVLIISCIFLVAFIINKLLEILSHSFDSRGVTICKLLINFVRYAAIFTSLYQCLTLIGVDAKTLVASAGILSLIIGFGANKLIQEVVFGLFIIFEGSFQVGDTISIGTGNNKFTGIVTEIGIRNTKVSSVDANVMIISNSKLDSVVNHSTAKTLIVYEYKVEKKIPLDRCDNFFESKLDYLKEKLGGIIKEIRYDGIVSYDVEAYTIRFSISCVEENKAKIEYKIDNEMKLLLDELQNTEIG